MKKITVSLLALLATHMLSASVVQDTLRGNAKFNVVAAVLVIIFSGIALFLFRLDRKITKLEKNRKENNK